MSVAKRAQEVITPSEEDVRQAVELVQRIAHTHSSGDLKIFIEGQDLHDAIALPPGVSTLLETILNYVSNGKSITLMPIDAEITTQQAADLLNVSRPYLVTLLDDGQIPHRKVGVRRRVLLSDILDYKRKIDDARLATLEELAQQAQELDMGY